MNRRPIRPPRGRAGWVEEEVRTPIVIDAGGYYIGGTGGADVLDYVEVTVGADGSYSPVLYWNSGQDMDFALYDSGLSELCHSWYSNPEDECGSLELAAGTYYAEMFDFSGGTFNATYRFVMFDDN